MTKHNKVTRGLLIIVIVATGLLTLTAHADVTVREIQLMLYLKKYDLGQAGVDGKLGSKTQKAISDYMAKSPSLYAGHENDLDYLRKTLKDDFRSGDAQPNPDKGNIEQDLNTLKNELDKTKTELNKFINKQSEQEKDYSKDMGLVNTGATFVLTIFSVLLALISIAGIAVYKLVKFKIEEQLDLSHHDKAVNVKSSVYMALARAFYLYYRSYMARQNYQQDINYKTCVDLSIWFCDRTFELVKTLNNVAEKEKKMKLVNINKSYHLATRQQAGDVAVALNNADMIKEYAQALLRNGNIKEWAAIQDTLAWVYIRSGQANRITEGKQIVSEMMLNNHLDQEFKDEISQNYNNIGVTI